MRIARAAHYGRDDQARQARRDLAVLKAINQVDELRALLVASVEDDTS
jgi:hypothetical protein